MKTLGLISGTSLDGIDAVIVDIADQISDKEPLSIEMLGFSTYPYPEGLRERILEVSMPGRGTVDAICHLNAYIGELFAEAALRIVEEVGVSAQEIEVIGSHGQTIQHLPNSINENGVAIRSTLQIGEPSIIAERTGITTVADFRPRDMAAGGQGAPLAPYMHYLLFRHPVKHRIVVNIGGISNLTYLPPGSEPNQVIAFDSGPGNMIIDQLVTALTDGTARYDRDGQWAALGTCHTDLLAWMLEHPYFQRHPPKSTGREEFGESFLFQVYDQQRQLNVGDNDLLHTATVFTAETIVQSCQTFLPIFRSSAQPPDKNDIQMLCCGGGVKNTTLMNILQARIAPYSLFSVDQFDVSCDALEAMTFAVLAWETIRGKTSNLPTVTGAKHPVVLGKIVPGIQFKGLRS